jgi:hypothetical protein
MAYFIFLKYLDSLEDFRKTLMSKFLLNLLVQISKAVVYSKIQFLFEKEFSSDFGPSGPAPPALAYFAPQATRSPLSPFGPSSFGIFAERRISFDFAPSGREAFSLLRHCHVGPRLSASSPSPRWPTHNRFSSSPPATLRHPASNLKMPSEVLTPRLDSPF